jgi:HlyD family secretion protein
MGKIHLAAGLFLSVLISTLFAAEPPPQGPPKVSCLGKITPADKIVFVTVNEPLSNTVRELMVKRGDTVKKGQILARTFASVRAAAGIERAKAALALAAQKLGALKSDTPEPQIAAQEAVVKAAETALRTAVADSEFEIKEDRSTRDTHYAKARASAAEESLFQAKELLHKLNKARAAEIPAAEKELELAKTALAAAEADLEMSTVRAPSDGKILEIFARPGESAGMSGILALADCSAMSVEAQVYVSDVKKVKAGDLAAVTGDAFDGTLCGAVSEISSMVDLGSLFPADPASLIDKRIVRVKINLDPESAAKAASLINGQVNVQLFNPRN